MLNILGWILNLIGVGMMIYGGFIGERVYTAGAYGLSSSVTVAHLPSLIVGGVCLIIGVMMVLTRKILDAFRGAKIMDSNIHPQP